MLSAEFHLAGLFGVDAIVNPQGVWPVEVNPRFPASAELCDWSTGGSVVARHVEACESGQLPATPVRQREGMLGKAIVFARRATTIADDGMPQLESTATWEWPAIADIPAPGSQIEAGWPIATVFAQGADADDTLAQLKRQVTALRTLLGDAG